MTRACAVAVIVLCCASTTRAQGVATYVSLVEQYARGDAAGAVTELARRGDQRLMKDIGDWMRQLSPAQIRAAAMMHTELAYVWLAGGQTAAGLLQIRNAERLVAIMIANSHDMELPRAFAIRWYAFATGMYTSQGQLDAAAGFVRTGLASFPRAAELYVARGSVMEMRAFMNNNDDMRRGIGRDGQPSLRVSRMLESAAADFQRAVDLDGRLAVAYLHRGWVHLRLRDNRAFRDLEAALAAADDGNDRYLAHLFLGALAERSGDLDGARREYEAARALGAYQTAYVALGRVEEASGHGERARTLALEYARLSAKAEDPWWDYLGGFSPNALAWLQHEARRP